ncbi:MAG: hypothetical protein AB7V62_15910 [Thermoleophilia bacterium]
MLVPAPLPAYTLAPGVGPLDAGQQVALDGCLAALTGRVTGVVVTAAGTTITHHVIELMTPAGTLLVLERVASELAVTLAMTEAVALD